MRNVPAKEIENTVYNLFLQACMCPGGDVVEALRSAREAETFPAAKEVFSQLLQNADIAKNEAIPYCQDTGMAIVFVDMGQEILVDGDLTAAINEGVRRAYYDGYFRKSVLDPITRTNTLDNTPAIIHYNIVPGDKVKITVSPKGFGSENMSKIAMLKPADGIEGIIDFVVSTAKSAGANPCPPAILGVGIGGDFEYAAIMAKRQLLRPLGEKNPDRRLADLEKEIMDKINALGIGAMGLGGENYCLAVHIEKYPTHLAGLPVAVNYCCHALRHAERIL